MSMRTSLLAYAWTQHQHFKQKNTISLRWQRPWVRCSHTQVGVWFLKSVEAGELWFPNRSLKIWQPHKTFLPEYGWDSCCALCSSEEAILVHSNGYKIPKRRNFQGTQMSPDRRYGSFQNSPFKTCSMPPLRCLSQCCLSPNLVGWKLISSVVVVRDGSFRIYLDYGKP